MKPSTQAEVVQILKTQLPVLRLRYGIRRLGLYGSFATDTQTSESDVDLVVELGRPLGFEFAAMISDLEDSLGTSVDVTTSETLEISRTQARHRKTVEDILTNLRYLDE